MVEALRLMCVFSHPDDESLGTGGTLARYAAEGVQVDLVTATRGERGWFGPEADNPGLEALGRIREAELLNAARVLGIRSVSFLDYVDGDLDQAPVQEAVSRIVVQLRRVRPHVILTFGPDGSYGHPDHIAISQLVGAAIVCAADLSYVDPASQQPYAVPKFYYMVATGKDLAHYEQIFGDLVMHIDGVARRGGGWPEWMVTTRIDTARYWQVAHEAISCHRSQLPGYESLLRLPEEQLRSLWSYADYYRVYSTVNGGRTRELDLFEGLR
jgi:LmbE family N-acetylglucosaminyl deacetylase